VPPSVPKWLLRAALSQRSSDIGAKGSSRRRGRRDVPATSRPAQRRAVGDNVEHAALPGDRLRRPGR
jgi:hypothetical protein